VIGDGEVDIAMFGEAGLSIAMGNASRWVRAAATDSAASNEDEGFARAVEELVLA
jgi:hydroxymethylpyrimidine pyrophosphatase-like HAD family hydrolase